MEYTRRELMKLALAAVPAMGVQPALALGADRSPKSTWSGVQIGIIAPYSFRGMSSNPEDMLKSIVALGLSAVELQSEGFESWAGAPGGGRGSGPGGRRGGGGPGGPGGAGGPGGGRGGPPLNSAQQTALRELNESLAGLNQKVAAVRAALLTASYAGKPAAEIKSASESVAAAELELANARAEAFAKLQSSPNKLSADQITALAQQESSPGGARGGRGGGGGGGGARGASGGLGNPGGPAADPAANARRDELRKWRTSTSMDKFKELRKLYNDAGVEIGLVKFGLGPSMADDEVDYAFQVAKTLGAKGITCEPPVSETRRLGQFADKHKLMIGYHGHSNVTSAEAFGRPGAWEQAFFYSKWNGANVDIGHFAAGNSVPATEFIKRYHDRITNLHLKDRKFNEGENVPWGQGDSQVKEILQLMKRERYNFMATIELEYRIPEGSDTMTELARCVQFCKDALA